MFAKGHAVKSTAWHQQNRRLFELSASSQFIYFKLNKVMGRRKEKEMGDMEGGQMNVWVKRDYSLEFNQPDESVAVVIQNPNGFVIEWQALLPVNGPKLFKLKPTKGLIQPQSETTITVEIRSESRQIPIQTKERVVLNFKDPSGSKPDTKRALRVFRSYLSQDASISSSGLSNSSLANASQIFPAAPSNGAQSSSTSTNPSNINSATSTSGSGSTGQAGSAPSTSSSSAGSGAIGSASQGIGLLTAASGTVQEASQQHSHALGRSELELKDPGFSMTLLIPFAVTCILIWILQETRSFLYSPWTTFILGGLTAYIHFRLNNPRKSSSNVSLSSSTTSSNPLPSSNSSRK
eukprot:TRINITY_DN8736_c0_g1_i1.p1 TRINITY_DN8736_c0_g1~~TRINITY_DN8736_c0_g1_i1.p1  ORF type:complete len:350 (+),score=45.65 TRINITY_DN8736_c0_g1_i1:1018-2067(+)